MQRGDLDGIWNKQSCGLFLNIYDIFECDHELYNVQ